MRKKTAQFSIFSFSICLFLISPLAVWASPHQNTGDQPNDPNWGVGIHLGRDHVSMVHYTSEGTHLIPGLDGTTHIAPYLLAHPNHGILRIGDTAVFAATSDPTSTLHHILDLFPKNRDFTKHELELIQGYFASLRDAILVDLPFQANPEEPIKFVLAVPDFFTDHHLMSLVNVVEPIGFSRLRIVPEHVAAVHSLNLVGTEIGVVTVFLAPDQFTTSTTFVDEGIVETFSTAQYPLRKNFDDIIAEYLYEKLAESYPSIENDQNLRDDIYFYVKNHRKEFVDGFKVTSILGYDFSLTWTRDLFLQLTHTLASEILDKVNIEAKELLVDENLSVEYLLLQGDTAPYLSPYLASVNISGAIPRIVEDKESTMQGLGQTLEILLGPQEYWGCSLEMTGVDYGFAEQRGEFTTVIHRLTLIPTKKWHTFYYKPQPAQIFVPLTIMQGNRPIAKFNEELETLLIRAEDFGKEGAVNVVFEVDVDARLFVTVSTIAGDQLLSVAVLRDVASYSQEKLNQFYEDMQNNQENDQLLLRELLVAK